jgi:hypothetical protein
MLFAFVSLLFSRSAPIDRNDDGVGEKKETLTTGLLNCLVSCTWWLLCVKFSLKLSNKKKPIQTHLVVIMSSRGQPVASQVCADRIQQRNYSEHRKKLASIKPSVDHVPPKMYPHLYQKLKKAQLEEERCSDIERDNRTLVKRMTEIMQRSGIDSKRPASMVASLNGVRRKQELARITRENHSLMKRIQERQPTYSHLQWEQDREVNEQLCERICKYPYRPPGNPATGSPSRTSPNYASLADAPPPAQQNNSNALPPIAQRPTTQ